MSIPIFQQVVNAGLNQTDAVKDASKLMTEARDSVARAQTYMIIGAVALAAIGIIMTFTIGAAAIIPIVMSAALVYGIYNLEHVKTNIDDIIANPSQCADVDLASTSVKVNADKIKNKLKENTIGFDWAVNLAIDNSPLAAD